MRKAHILQHVPFENEGTIKDWLAQNNYKISRTCLYKNENLPNVEEIDFLIVMGGPMSIHDEEEFPWLTLEKSFIRSAIEQEKKMLGICLGAQLFADALGAEIKKNNQPEIGWFQIEQVKENPFLAGLPEKFYALHWHGETFSIPKEGERLFKSKACKNQAFSYNGFLLGLQFHIETSQEGLKNLIMNCRNELIQSPYVQNEKELEEGISKHSTKEILFKMLDNLTQD